MTEPEVNPDLWERVDGEGLQGHWQGKAGSEMEGAEMSVSTGGPDDPICIGCGHTPEELDEYRIMAEGEDMTPTQFVQQEEGTYNPRNGHFACTACYIRMGQPSGPERQRWVAP